MNEYPIPATPYLVSDGLAVRRIDRSKPIRPKSDGRVVMFVGGKRLTCLPVNLLALAHDGVPLPATQTRTVGTKTDNAYPIHMITYAEHLAKLIANAEPAPSAPNTQGARSAAALPR